MKKSKTFTEGVLASVAAVAFVGLTYVGGSEKTVDLKATSSHTIVISATSSYKPQSLGYSRISDETFGLSNGGYLTIGLSGKGDKEAHTGSNYLFTETKSNDTTTTLISLTIDIFANGITSGSFVCGSALQAKANLVTTVTLFSEGYSENPSSETTLKTASKTTSIDSTGISGTANHIRYFISETEDLSKVTNGYWIFITSVSVSFSC
jgi:hypothetical protein